MGTKNQGLAHSKAAWQNTEEGFEPGHTFDFPVRGNFGGTVYAYPDLNWIRDEIEIAIKSFKLGRQYFNCSDGAYIKGTTAKNTRAIKLQVPSRPRAEEGQKIIYTFQPSPKSDLDNKWNYAYMQGPSKYYFDIINAYFVSP